MSWLKKLFEKKSNSISDVGESHNNKPMPKQKENVCLNGEYTLGEIEKVMVVSLLSHNTIDPAELLEQLSEGMKFSYSNDITPATAVKWIQQNPIRMKPDELVALAHKIWTDISCRGDLAINVTPFFNPVTREGLILLVRRKKQIDEKSRYARGYFPIVYYVTLYANIETSTAKQKLVELENVIKSLNPTVKEDPFRNNRLEIESEKESKTKIVYKENIEFYDEEKLTTFFHTLENWLMKNTKDFYITDPKQCPECKCYNDFMRQPIPGHPCIHCGFEPKRD